MSTNLLDFLQEERDGMSLEPRPPVPVPKVFNRDRVVQDAVAKFPSRWDGHANPDISILVRSIVDSIGDEIDRIVEDKVR